MRYKILLLFALLSGLLIAAFFTNAQSGQINCCFDSVFLLTGDRRALLGEDYFGGQGDHGIVAIVIIPYEVNSEVVSAAWSYAVQFTADGLTLPNYPDAVALLLERHPTWTAAITKGYTIGFNQERAMTDIPDATLTPIPESTENP